MSSEYLSPVTSIGGNVLTNELAGLVLGAVLIANRGYHEYNLHQEATNLSQKEKQILVENHKLLHRENVILTPHLAFYTKEALERILNTTKDNISAFKKNTLQNIVMEFKQARVS